MKNALYITRHSVANYLDSGKLFNNKWILSSLELSLNELSKWAIPSKVWEVVTGELLGHIRYDPINAPSKNGRLEFTIFS